MGLFQDKRGIVFGVANHRSIAWAVARLLSSEGAELILTYQNERLRETVSELAARLPRCETLPCDVSGEEEVAALFRSVHTRWKRLDFLLHAVAFARSEDLEGEYLKASRAGFEESMRISVYSLTQLVRAARSLLSRAPEGGSVLTLSYIGAEKAVPGYNVMGVAKAALESSLRYLACDLGPQNTRINAISAGPVNTLAARAIPGFTELIKHARAKAPLGRNITAEEVGKASLFLLSGLSSAVTGEVLHVDAGYHAVGL